MVVAKEEKSFLASSVKNPVNTSLVFPKLSLATQRCPLTENKQPQQTPPLADSYFYPDNKGFLLMDVQFQTGNWLDQSTK